MTNRALKPVRQIVDTANSLNPDDLSKRIPEVGTDEFAHLAKTINSLLAKVEGMFDQLRQAIEREWRFTADASHELRTPLTAIKANTTLALRGDRTPAQYKDTLHIVDQSANVMSQLVQDLLLLARTDSGQLKLTFHPVDPQVLFDEAVAVLRRQESDPQLEIQIANSPGTILGDSEQLRRLLVNLLDNAFRHTPSSGRVIMTAAVDRDRVVLTILDTGEGIAPEHLPHLGERFYRVDAARTRNTGGTGLGLAICKSIVEAHQGSMTIDSTLGKGTVGTLALNRAQDCS